jgi:hypothetical protein
MSATMFNYNPSCEWKSAFIGENGYARESKSRSERQGASGAIGRFE